jgi:hypothetical protein
MDRKWITLIIVGIIAIFVAANYQKIYKAVVPPKPVVVSSSADDGSSGFLEYSMRVKTTVSNQGGDGDIVIEVTAYQGENHWTKTKNIHMGASQTDEVEFVFDEVKFFDKDPKYSVRAYALGH